MPHVLVAGKIHEAGLDILRHATGVTFDYVEDVSEPSYAPLVSKADGLVIRTQPLSAATVAMAPKLKIVSRHGVGYDAVHLPSLNERRIALAIVGDVNSLSVAEHAMMMLLAAAKRAIRADRSVREGDWGWRDRLEAVEISGRNLLIVGYGRIGRHLARMAKGFGMNIRAYDPYLEKAGWPRGDVAPCSDLLEGLGWADAISVHVPKAGAPLIGPRELGAMKSTAILLNTARGGVVDEVALAQALAAGRLAAAGLDVFDDEPPKPDNPLFGLSQVIFSPHNAGLTAEAGERMAVSSVRNVLDFFAGRIDPDIVVNGAALDGR